MKSIKKAFVPLFLILTMLVHLLSGMMLVSADDSGYVGEIRWDFIEGTEGAGLYTAASGSSGELTQSNDKLNVNIKSLSGGKQIGFVFNEPIVINRDVHNYIVIRADIPSGITGVKAYLYDTTQEPQIFYGWEYANAVIGQLYEGMTTYALRLDESKHTVSGSNAPVASGTYNKLEIRFNLDTDISEITNNVIGVDYVAIGNYYTDAVLSGGQYGVHVKDTKNRPSIIERICVNGDEFITLPTAEAYSTSEINSLTYENFDELLNCANVSYADGYTDTSFAYKLTEKTGYKLLDITANGTKESEEYTQSYRIKITSKPDPLPEVVIDECTYSSKMLKFSGYVMNGRGDDYVRNEQVLVMAYNKDSGMGTWGENLDVWKIVTTDENGEFSGSAMIRDYEVDNQLHTMEVVFCSADSIAYSDVTYYNDTCVEELVADMATKTNGVFAYMSDGINKTIFESMGVAFEKYEAYNSSEQATINNNTKAVQSDVTMNNVVEIANGTLLSYASKKAINDTALISILEDFDKNVMEIKIKGDNLASFSKINPSSRKQTIISHFKNNVKSTDYDNWFKFKNVIQESMLLEYISTQRSSAIVKKAILENKDIILYEKTTDDADVINKLQSEQNVSPDDATTYLLNQQKGTAFANAEALLSALKTALEKTGDTSGSDDSNNNNIKDSFVVSGGGGGGGIVKDKVEEKPEDKVENAFKNHVYSDLKNYEWAEESINHLSELGIVSGVGNGLYEPYREVTREEFTKLLCEAFDFDGNDNEINFTDVPKDAWYRKYVSCAVANGIVNGISDDMFGSGRKITREDMAVLIFRALKAVNKDITSENIKFNDYNQTSEYAQEAISLLAGAEIVNGVGNNNFAPKAVASRAEAAVIIHRCIKLLKQ